MPKANRDAGDADLHRLFERFNAQLVSPGGAAALLGLSRKTIHTLGKRGRIRVFEGPEQRSGPMGMLSEGPRWVYIPIIDLARYAEEVGRPFPELSRMRAEAAEREAAELDLTESDDSPTV
jgi:hypothetical protein